MAMEALEARRFAAGWKDSRSGNESPEHTATRFLNGSPSIARARLRARRLEHSMDQCFDTEVVMKPECLDVPGGFSG